MITKEILQPFCGTDETRYVLQQPFARGDFTYATDGRILVRTERFPEMENELTMSATDGMFTPQVIAQSLEPMPELPAPIYDVCPECGQSTKDEVRVAVTVGPRLISSIYLRKIAALPAPVMIGVTGDNFTPARFTFDGGEGLIMPMREP